MSDLKPGLRWARHRKGHNGNQWSRWVLIEIKGKSPFLKGTIVFDPGGDEGNSPYFSSPTDVEAWQYGPELEIPSEHWIEVKPASGTTFGRRSDD